MNDDLDQLIKQYSPDILKDQFSKLCYEIFIKDDKGKTLLGHLYNQHVYRPFSNLLDKDSSYDTNKVLARAAQRDLVQSLLVCAQSYEAALHN